MRTQIAHYLKEARSRDGLAIGPLGDFALNQQMPRVRDPVAAAVLIPIVDHEQGMTILLTRRTDHLHDHAGQVSFPGGRVEEHDADEIATALRETEEEIGLARERIEIIASLDRYETSTGFAITPIVGVVEPGFELTLDPFEVAEVFEIPIELALDPDNYRRESRPYKGHQRYFYVLPHEQYYIWGATAGILRRLSGILADLS